MQAIFVTPKAQCHTERIKVKAISETECYTQQINNDEQFSPTLTVVDAATQQTLDYCCMLKNLQKYAPGHALFCYTTVQVKVSEPNTTCVVCGNYICPPVAMSCLLSKLG